jgi:hypothetical protein
MHFEKISKIQTLLNYVITTSTKCFLNHIYFNTPINANGGKCNSISNLGYRKGSNTW